MIRRRLAPCLLPVCLLPVCLFPVCLFPVAAVGGAARAAAHRHPRPAAVAANPVILTQLPDSALDRAARQLNAGDLAGAARRHEQPVVLIGSAPLSARHGETALFVQVQSASLCGSAGCSTSVYLRRGPDWDKVLDSVSGPIKVLATTHGGMHDLVVGDRDRWVWAGDGYRDTLPAEPIGSLRRDVQRHQERMRDAAHPMATPPT